MQSKAEEEKEKQAKIREKYAKVDHYQALAKVVRHLYNQKKFSKCLGMIGELVRQYFDFFDGNTLFNAFEAVMRYSKKFELKEDREAIE